MVSQDLIYSVLPRQTTQVAHQPRMVEKVTKRSSLKSTDENESSLEPEFKVERKRRGDRRGGERRTDAPEVTDDNCEPNDDDKPASLDIYI